MLDIQELNRNKNNQVCNVNNLIKQESFITNDNRFKITLLPTNLNKRTIATQTDINDIINAQITSENYVFTINDDNQTNENHDSSLIHSKSEPILKLNNQIEVGVSQKSCSQVAKGSLDRLKNKLNDKLSQISIRTQKSVSPYGKQNKTPTISSSFSKQKIVSPGTPNTPIASSTPRSNISKLKISRSSGTIQKSKVVHFDDSFDQSFNEDDFKIPTPVRKGFQNVLSPANTAQKHKVSVKNAVNSNVNIAETSINIMKNTLKILEEPCTNTAIRNKIMENKSVTSKCNINVQKSTIISQKNIPQLNSVSELKNVQTADSFYDDDVPESMLYTKNENDELPTDIPTTSNSEMNKENSVDKLSSQAKDLNDSFNDSFDDLMFNSKVVQKRIIARESLDGQKKFMKSDVVSDSMSDSIKMIPETPPFDTQKVEQQTTPKSSRKRPPTQRNNTPAFKKIKSMLSTDSPKAVITSNSPMFKKTKSFEPPTTNFNDFEDDFYDDSAFQ